MRNPHHGTLSRKAAAVTFVFPLELRSTPRGALLAILSGETCMPCLGSSCTHACATASVTSVEVDTSRKSSAMRSNSGSCMNLMHRGASEPECSCACGICIVSSSLHMARSTRGGSHSSKPRGTSSPCVCKLTSSGCVRALSEQHCACRSSGAVPGCEGGLGVAPLGGGLGETQGDEQHGRRNASALLGLAQPDT